MTGHGDRAPAAGTSRPSASEVLEVLDRLQRDQERRMVLMTSYGIHEAMVAEGVLPQGQIDWLAICMQELVSEELIVYGSVSGGAYPPPESALWDGGWLQQLHDWRVTAKGRSDAKLYRDELAREAGGAQIAPDSEGATSDEGDRRDLFISHASEDKAEVARPLADRLRGLGWTVWLDETELTIGDSLERHINLALARSRFGVVILSPNFFAREFPQRELQGLAAREVASGTKVILPVWHNIDRDQLLQVAPMLADKLGALTSNGLDSVAGEIDRAL